VPVISVLAVGGVLLLSGCQSTSHRCVNGKCHVTVSGAGQTVEVNDVDVTVSQISTEGMTVSAGGSAPAVIANGECAQVGPVSIRVTSIDGQKVKFDLE
jgi:type 1 fimbria pilin